MDPDYSSTDRTAPGKAGCDQHNFLLDDFKAAAQAVLKLHERRFLAIVDGDEDRYSFDLLIHMANDQKQSAKYAYLRHVEAHGCAGA